MNKPLTISKKDIFLLIIFGLFSFLLFILLLFPKEKIVHHFLHQLSEQLGCNLTVQELHLSFPARLEMFNIEMKGKEEKKKSLPYLQIDHLTVKPNLSRLLQGKIHLLFDLQLYKGKLIGGAFFHLLHPKQLEGFSCSLKDVQLEKMKSLEEILKVRLSGQLTGEANLKLTPDNILQSVGEYSFIISPGEAQIKDFPRFAYQKIQGEGHLGRGKVKIKSLSIHGDGVQAQINGDLRLNPTLISSYLNTRVYLTFTPEFIDKLGPLASFLPRRQKDGFNVNIRGNLNKLSFIPI